MPPFKFPCRSMLPALAFIACLLAVPLFSEDSRFDGFTFNVKRFGAKGDGKTDDTKAIQAAFDAAAKKTVSRQPYPGSAYYFAAPYVYFPIGQYNISDTIKMSTNVLGEGPAIIYQTNKEKDCLSDPKWAWRRIISGVTFVGGKSHLVLGNNDVDTGRIIIEKCTFFNSAGPSIKTLKGSNSTLVTVKDCVFYNCDQVLVNWCDLASISDTWITTAKAMKNKAVIENHATLLMEHICGVPIVVSDSDQRWIDNYGSVTCRNVRFGGEFGGFTAVVNFAAYDYEYVVVPKYVILDSCTVFSAMNLKRKAAVYCEEIPNLISITRCTGFMDSLVIMVSDRINLDTYFDNAKDPTLVRIDIGDEQYFPWGTGIPEQMKPYLTGEITSDRPPTSGIWRRGQFVKRVDIKGHWQEVKTGEKTEWKYVGIKPVADKETHGWLCVESGKPGRWKPVPFDKMIK